MKPLVNGFHPFDRKMCWFIILLDKKVIFHEQLIFTLKLIVLYFSVYLSIFFAETFNTRKPMLLSFSIGLKVYLFFLSRRRQPQFFGTEFHSLFVLSQ